ncbi:unnamed protein product [Ostreobium quekettii]|uniref:Mitochondrial import inner membrane translocase subunit TIM50 n=1 Tax=Ostreobium quekettii TaxID=121088 RepID=A0A8S1IK51_9CHLO|nr:unnamed protein product [Ostreobium quekettii]|eukprot:evm.model.scf_130EXC.1 EVM.evm.TU.scf_130EXC.1   scf_130EXC:34561-35613(+)
MVAWSIALPALAATAWILIGSLLSVLAPGLLLSLGRHAAAARAHQGAGAKGIAAGCGEPERAAADAQGAKLRRKEEANPGGEDECGVGAYRGAGAISAFLGTPELADEEEEEEGGLEAPPGCVSMTRHTSVPHERPRFQSHPVPRELDLFMDAPSNLTVVLDLDETLVRSYSQDNVPVHLELARELIKLEVDCVGRSGATKVVSFLRPGLFEFLARVSRLANVYVYTAGDADYARPLIRVLDCEGRFFKGAFYREATVATSLHDHVKDLEMLGADLTSTVLVDNNPYSFLLQPDNGLLCESFFGEPEDTHLLDVVLPTLQLLARVSDVRPILRRRYNLAGWCQALEGWCD